MIYIEESIAQWQWQHFYPGAYILAAIAVNIFIAIALVIMLLHCCQYSHPHQYPHRCIVVVRNNCRRTNSQIFIPTPPIPPIISNTLIFISFPLLLSESFSKIPVLLLWLLRCQLLSPSISIFHYRHHNPSNNRNSSLSLPLPLSPTYAKSLLNSLHSNLSRSI